MRKATAFVAVMAWTVFAVAIAPFFIANGDSKVLAANFGGAIVAAEANKAVVNATPVQETMKDKESVVIDNGAPIKDGVTVPLVNYSENTKVVLGRGQNLSYIAWKYTGDADNWKHIAQASGLKTDSESQRRVFVGTILVIPQELLKQVLKPEPPAKRFTIAISILGQLLNSEADLLKKLADAQRELWLWRGVSALLVFVMLLVFWAAFGAIKQRERKYKNLETENESSWKLIPGSLMDFQTREDKTLRAMITRVELEEHCCVVNPIVTEVECSKCRTRVNPKNFLSHYFQQHSVAEPAKESC